MTVTTRPMTRRLRMRGWLVTRSPLHVGGAGGDPNGVLHAAVDGRGRLYVPGTGITGALRTLTHPEYGSGDEEADRTADLLWGHATPRTQEGTVSRIVVRDALITTDKQLDSDGLPLQTLNPARLEVRHSVGIDRHTGTAAQGLLHGRVVVPTGSFLRLELDLNSTEDSIDDDRRRMRQLLRLLSEEGLQLGAAKTRGLGRAQLLVAETDVREEDFSSAAGLLAALEGNGPAWCSEDWAEEPLPARESLSIRIDWRPTAPVMVRSATDGFAVDALPLASAVTPDAVSLVLPGTSLKGIMRSCAERIERTVRRLDAPAAAPGQSAPERSAAFREQLDQLPAVRALFGSAPLRGSGTGRGVGAVTVDDCYAKETMPAELWARAHGPEAADTASPVTPLRDYRLERADHVAIDRWTGGAADGRLYSVLEPHGVEWQPIRLTVDLARLKRWHADYWAAGTALLMLVLRDLAAGRIPIGYATNRGLGDIAVDRVLLTFRPGNKPVELTDYLSSEDAAGLSKAWRTYLDEEPS
ncbi:RAMP superfamily CRISPR-associated protein [Streptomyces cellulosae]